jgi:hypothetical protein
LVPFSGQTPFDSESQIEVTLFPGKPPSVIYATADKNVFASAYTRVKAGDKPRITSSDEAAITRIAKSITVRSKALQIDPERVLGWQQSMFRSLGDLSPPLRREAENATISLILDGPMYEVRFAQGLQEFSGRFAQTPDGLPIAQWAESLRSEIENAN